MSAAHQTARPVTIDGEEFDAGECNGSDRCDVAKHVHGCFSDVGHCDEPSDHPALPVTYDAQGKVTPLTPATHVLDVVV